MNGINFIGRGIDFRLTEHDESKQDVLVPGQNIKNINGVSLVGSGNIVIADWPAYDDEELAIEYPVVSSGMEYDSGEQTLVIS